MTRRKAQRDKVLRSIFLIFRLFSAVTRTCLHTFGNACGIERAADNVITNAGQILDTSAPDMNGRVFLQVVTCLLVRRTLAIFLIAELGFLGVVVVTERHTPRF